MNQIILYEYGKSRNLGFTSTWNTNNTSTGSSAANQVKLPLDANGSYNFVVYWGDGLSNTITVWNQAETTHTYASAGTYTIRITGTINGFRFNATGDRLKILSVSRWGQLKLNHTIALSGNFFNGCANLNLSGVVDVLDISNVTSFINAFSGCTTLTTVNRMNEWNTANITTMQACFDGCTNFNQDIGNWNTATNAQFGAMFRNCTMFNQNIGSWNMFAMNAISQMFFGCTAFNNGGSPSINNWTFNSVGPAISFFEVFRGCTNFNQPIGNWVTNRVSSMQNTFLNCINFNQNIGGWVMSNVTTFSGTFDGCTVFNNGGSPSISGWITSTSTLFTSMFRGCPAFNQPLAWNVSLGQNFSSMFSGCTVFNNGLASGVAGVMNWITPALTNTASMFQSCTAFNQDVGSFTMTNSTGMGSMFSGCTNFNNGGSSSIGNWFTSASTSFNSTFFNCVNFNQPLPNWSVSAALTISSMFNTCPAFSQNIGHFRPVLSTNSTQFMNGKTPATYSTANMDAIYNGWTQGALQTAITTSFGSAKYTTASSAGRALLTRASATIAVTGAANNGSGLIRITSVAHGRATNDKVYVSGVGGVPNATGGWIVSVIDANTIDLQGSTFAGAFTSGGTTRTGWGWSITDGGL